jgi:hypothetical protein
LYKVINRSIIQSKCNQNALKIPFNSINLIPSVDFDQSIQVELIFLIVLLVDNSANNTPHYAQRVQQYAVLPAAAAPAAYISSK